MEICSSVCKQHAKNVSKNKNLELKAEEQTLREADQKRIREQSTPVARSW